MGKTIIGIVGSYRKGGINDQVTDAILKTVQQEGAQTEKIYLIDKHIEFCTNCRVCTQDDRRKIRGTCVLDDDMNELLSKIDHADGLILASPVNFYNVTAITKRFIERLIVYAYWPWGKRSIPQQRIKKTNKKAIIITSSACPAFVGRILMPGTLKLLKSAARIVGARVVKSLYFGNVCSTPKQKLSEKQLQKARSAARLL
ncbi:MAG: flavodoxin family protein [Caldiserica bacterium]|nr:flavodoxin family protein [Caldisericota bacterium]